MPDAFITDRATPEPVDVGTALRALPLQMPPRSVWPHVAAQLQPPVAEAPRAVRGSRRMPRRWLALAAMLALALVLPRWLSLPTNDGSLAGTDPAATSAPITAPGDDLDTLLRESAQLEAWIAWTGTPARDAGGSASLALDLHDRIAVIDTLLASSDLDPAAQQPLLQERLLRLRELAGLQNTRQLLAAHGDEAQVLPVTVF